MQSRMIRMVSLVYAIDEHVEMLANCVANYDLLGSGFVDVWNLLVKLHEPSKELHVLVLQDSVVDVDTDGPSAAFPTNDAGDEGVTHRDVDA